VALRAFLVEDNSSIRQALAAVLSELANTRVIGFATQAVEASNWFVANEKNWDVAIIDLELAAGSGLTVLAACRVRDAHQHAVVFSASASPGLRQRCLDFGADAVFDKANETDDLLHYCASLSPAK
jgi:DNA-binding NarL/FixJ family response regulator